MRTILLMNEFENRPKYKDDGSFIKRFNREMRLLAIKFYIGLIVVIVIEFFILFKKM